MASERSLICPRCHRIFQQYRWAINAKTCPDCRLRLVPPDDIANEIWKEANKGKDKEI